MNNQEIVQSYTRSLSANPDRPWAASHWGSERAQRARLLAIYRHLVDARPFVWPPKTVLDVGCGDGILVDYVRQFGVASYEGWDCTPAMVEAARRREPKWTFVVQDFMYASDTKTGVYDYVIASGVFGERSWEYMLTAIDVLWALARRAVAFNFLTTWGDCDAAPGEFQADPVRVLRACPTRRVLLDTSYLGPYDATVVIFKDPV